MIDFVITVGMFFIGVVCPLVTLWFTVRIVLGLMAERNEDRRENP